MSNDLVEIEAQQTSLQDATVLQAITRAEIDTLITTARSYPRTISKARKQMMDLATLDEEAAEECVYSLPRGGKTLEGPSIRFAELAAQCWGNCRVAARTTLTDKQEMYVESEGFFLDAETNYATVARTRRSIRDKGGRCFNADMITVTANAAQSIARRNAILAGIPKSVWRGPYEAARKVIMGDVKTLANRRADAIKAFQRFGLTEAQVLALMGVKGVEDIDQERLVPLRGMFSALQNQEVTVEDLLKGIEPEKPARVSAATAPAAPHTAFETDGLPQADAGPVAAAAAPTAAAVAPDKKPDTAAPQAESVPEKKPDAKADSEPQLFAEPDDRDIIVSDLIAAIKGAANREAAEKLYLDADATLQSLDKPRRDKIEAVYQAAVTPKKKRA